MTSPLSSRFLSALSPQSRSALLANCTAVALPVRTVLYEPGHTPNHAFFITSGIASVVTTMEDGGCAEVEVIGHEGLAGGMHLLGGAKILTRCFMQLAGTGLRIPLMELQQSVNMSPDVRQRLLELVQEQVLTISQIAGCNRLHSAEERLARWLLMVQDRVQSDTLEFTQEFLAEMLGAQRTTVTTVAGLLQRTGCIAYKHGQVTILDRAGLERAACDCYRITRDLLTTLYHRPLA